MLQASLANHQGAHKCIHLGLMFSSSAHSITAGNSSMCNIYSVDRVVSSNLSQIDQNIVGTCALLAG
jgi:hypothetical protein